MKFSLNIVFALLIVSTVLVISSSYIQHQNSKQRKESISQVTHTYKVIQTSTYLISLMKDMETGQHGFIITGDSSFLEPYYDAKEDITQALDTLTGLVRENNRQALLMQNHIEPIIRKKQEFLDHSLSTFNRHGQDSSMNLISAKTGKTYMDTLRVLMNDLSQHERYLLNLHNEEYEKGNEREDLIRLGSMILIVITSASAFLALYNKQRQNRALLYDLEEANSILEQKVSDRTAEIGRKNEETLRLNEELKQNIEELKVVHTRLIELNYEKDHFLGIASHDLKSPVSGLLRLIEVMKVDNPNRQASDLQYLGYMEDACINMQRLIENLLDINKIEHGSTEINVQKVPLNKILDRLSNEFTPIAMKKNITLRIAQSSEAIYTDEDVLVRILENLLSNAIKFSYPEKEVTLKVHLSDGNVIFEIIDHGLGIRNEDLPRIFTKFERLNNKPTAGEGSTGLGLSIVKELIPLINGEISVSSKVAEGTTFKVILPA
ncbi:sensor histidine kinase [Ohtaekwangia koreensis]|uniref:histidine kinase n=1 Tax=Ohtaekwangia koreensis TaxID=688867 RepID=A0A1T5ISV3_9BACT|nr:CHASE3 domain-containing protein [Ohtaekwangia koreensis]SKC42068.1 Signal transduction histidine kinase [Ohtaekwangia koreensis]